MSKRPVFATPSRPRKLPLGASNTQIPFVDDMDNDWELDENDLDENCPIMRDVSFYSQQQPQSSIQQQRQSSVQQQRQAPVQQQRQSSTQQQGQSSTQQKRQSSTQQQGQSSTQQQRQSATQKTHNNKNTSTFYTPQVKRKRVQDQLEPAPQDIVSEHLNIIQSMIKDINRKIDVVAKLEKDFEKKLDNVDKRLGGLIRHVNKFPTPNEPPNDLPIIEYNGRNLLAGPRSPTPACLMKRLINQLFTKEEIINHLHEQINERTSKIRDAIQAFFFYDDDDKIEGFWDFEGKIIRGNQRRGLVYRQKRSSISKEKPTTNDENEEPTTDNENEEPTIILTMADD